MLDQTVIRYAAFMPQGYYTIEQWTRSGWREVAVLPFGLSLTAAEQGLAQLGKPGFYRLLQMQRVIWAEQDESGLRLRKSHASSPQNLKRLQEMFDRTRGRYPVEEVRAARSKQKSSSPKRRPG
jgi:hypothetical protein